MPAFAVSDTTQKLLKNFSSISNSVLLLEGKAQKTVLQSKAVFAIAEFPEAWPKETGIYDLGMFLSTLSLFEKPTVDFKDDSMVITNANLSSLSVRYRYSDPSTIMAIGDKTFPKDDPAVEFTLSEYALSQVKKTAAMLKLSSLNIAVKDGNVAILAADPKNSASHAFKLDIPKSEVTVHDAKFHRTIPFKVEHLGYLLDGNYTVALSSWRYAYVTNKAVPVSYYVTEQVKDWVMGPALFFFDQDESSHWYLIPAEKRAEWEVWTNLDSDDERTWDAPEWAKELGCHPSLYVFENPERT